MKNQSISAISPLDGRYHKHLESLRQCTSEQALIGYRAEVEIKWLIHLCEQLSSLPALDSENKKELNQLISEFSENDALQVRAIEQRTNHDVKAVEYWIKEKLQASDLQKHQELVHFACTSEDINNLAYGLMMQQVRKQLIQQMQSIDTQLLKLTCEHAATPMLSRTHGQPASPTTLGKETGNSLFRLRRQQQQLRDQPIFGKINGAVGNFNAHQLSCPNENWLQISRDFTESLGLDWNPMTTQIEPHDTLAEIFHTLIRYNNILLDLCRDIWSYISIGYFSQRAVEGEIGSSTMPHKVNPIDFENAEGNLGLANALLEHMASKLQLSRWQRDLSDSTVLRNTGSAAGYSLLAYTSVLRGLNKLQVNRTRLEDDLEQSHEVLAEAVQTVMRLHGIENPYEQLKKLTRGKNIDSATIRDFVAQLDIPAQAKDTLQRLTPATYTGLAKELVEHYVIDQDYRST